MICSFNFLIFLAVCLNISTVMNIKILANSNQQIQSSKFTSHIAAFLSVVLITEMLEICIQTSYDQNVQLILKSYLPVDVMRSPFRAKHRWFMFSPKKWYFINMEGPSWSWSWVQISLKQDVLYTTLYDKICQWLAAGRRFSLGILDSSTNKTYFHDITEILWH